jgi:hypothetical protein
MGLLNKKGRVAISFKLPVKEKEAISFKLSAVSN